MDARVPAADDSTGTRRAAGELHLGGGEEPQVFEQKAGQRGFKGRSEITQPERHVLRPDAEGPVPHADPNVPESVRAQEEFLERNRLQPEGPGPAPEGPYTRAHDAEAKVLEQASAAMPEDAKGTFYLRTSHPPCPSCIEAVYRFQAAHPGVKVILV
jgi:hypothetical protein